MLQLEYRGHSHVVVSITEKLGNKLSYDAFTNDEKFEYQYDSIEPKVITLADNGYDTVKDLNFIGLDSTSKKTCYIKDRSSGTRIHFQKISFKGVNLIIISDVYFKNKGKQSKALTASTELIEEAIRWISNNEKKFQNIIK